MPVPHRIFTEFHHISAHGYDVTGGANFAVAADWLNDHVETPILGWKRVTAGIWERYDLFYKGTVAQGWGEISGADKVMSLVLTFTALPPYYNVKPITKIDWNRGTLRVAGDEWDVEFGTGKYVDGVADEYSNYPHMFHAGCTTQIVNYSNIDVPTVPTLMNVWHEAWCPASSNALSYSHSTHILTRGMVLEHNQYVPSTAFWGVGDGIFMNVALQHVRMKYFNPVCNSLSRYIGPTAGGFELKFYGLGFHNAEAEIDEGGSSRFADVGTNWDDFLDYIYIEDLDGNVVSTLERDIFGWPGSRDFSVDSNGQVTLRSFPALPAGIYQFRLKKLMSLVGNPPAEGYAGDWRADAAGRMIEGERLYIVIGDEEKVDVPLSRWRWKKGTNYLYRYVAPIDVRSTLVFYDGFLLSMSSFTRGTNDRNGLPLFPDLEVELDNSTREYSELLAEYWCKNQPVEIYTCYNAPAEIFKEIRFRGIVVDYDKPGATWRVRLRDILAKYFELRLPQYRCTVEEYPSIHPNFIGREMPEAIGLCEYTEGTTPGAVEAIYVDTTIFKYLALRGPGRSILAVYSDGALVAPADYSILYADGGRTYIVFDADQEEAKITFDCEGYSYVDWDWGGSPGGYVRNPAYVILFVLAFFFGIPEDDIDIDSFDLLAADYEALGEDDSGYLVIQDEKEATQLLQELLFTYGAKMWVAADGRITVGRKDVSELTPDAYLFQQIDAIEEAQKPSGFSEACNYAPVRWRHYPTANLFVGSKVAQRLSSISAFEAEIMPSQAFDFPWTDSETLADFRAEEELLKLGFGDQRLQLKISTEHIDELDILSTFRFQDPWGISLTGGGDVGRYFYVEKITYNLMDNTMEIEAIDLEWLLREYMILGDEDEIADNWSSASEADRMWAYLCDELTWEFADAEPGKIMMDENA
jgi:hypothetical protein